MEQILTTAFVAFFMSGTLMGAAQPSEAPVPNIAGLWDRGGTAGSLYSSPETGPGPIIDTAGDALGAGWRSNYDSPILQPWAAAVGRQRHCRDQHARA